MEHEVEINANTDPTTIDPSRVQKAYEIQQLLEGSNRLVSAWVTCLCVVTFDLEFGQSAFLFLEKILMFKSRIGTYVSCGEVY